MVHHRTVCEELHELQIVYYQKNKYGNNQIDGVINVPLFTIHVYIEYKSVTLAL